MRERIWGIDVLRGTAVVAMVLYHFSYDLAYLAGLFDVRFFRSGLGLEMGRAIGTSFVFLAGLSLALSRRKAVASRHGRLFRKYLGRGLRIFSYGMIITFVTWIFAPDEMIVFGVLHLIGASTVLAYPFLESRLPNLFFGLGCLALGSYLAGFHTGEAWLTWLGIRPAFPTLDYWPIFPWFGVVLLGVFAGNALFGGDRKRAATHPSPPPVAVRPLAFLGRHSLPVYLAHQPILIAALFLLGVGNL